MERRKFVGSSLLGAAAYLSSPSLPGASPLLQELAPDTLSSPRPEWMFFDVPVLALDKPDEGGFVYPKEVVEKALERHYRKPEWNRKFYTPEVTGRDYRINDTSVKDPVFRVITLGIDDTDDGPVLAATLVFGMDIVDDFDFENPRSFADFVPRHPDLCEGFGKGELPVFPVFKNMRGKVSTVDLPPDRFYMRGGEFTDLDFDHFGIGSKEVARSMLMTSPMFTNWTITQAT